MLDRGGNPRALSWGDGRPKSMEEFVRNEMVGRKFLRNSYLSELERNKKFIEENEADAVRPNDVVKTGKPVVLDLFHGTRSAGFSAFSERSLGKETGAPSAKQAFFFAADPDLASSYAVDTGGVARSGSGLYRVLVRMDNPLVEDFHNSRYRETSYNDIITSAKKAGHDGVVFLNTWDPGFNS